MKMQNLRDHLNEVQDKLDYWFDNIDLLLQAFTRSSYSSQYGGENNEVLEFIGDKVLDFYVVKSIADCFGFKKSQSDYYDGNENDEFCIVAHKNEADFTEWKKDLVSNQNLAKIIDKLGFAKYMYIGDSDVANGVVHQEKVKADLLEAILGAIAIDCEWNQGELQNKVEYLLQLEAIFDDVDTEEERPAKFQEENAVNTLKEMAEHNRCSIPEYNLPDEQVWNGEKLWWSCTCTIRSWGVSKTAYATSKKIAKKYSAYLVLCEHFGLPNEFELED